MTDKEYTDTTARASEDDIPYKEVLTSEAIKTPAFSNDSLILHHTIYTLH